ncbi:1,4-alpha-glucan branching enzyme GlgB [Sulfurimicrobium lacus]|uniref:1,4-alpha-glucan branching enzyme GlgB n=1 Tax=Sulfurimicrobium lacus TaxID=2715678 RepID=A0A6F8VDJ1_9PROT|nr:1,4-alpha-glucan branching protein GlgB [Sulfurimicrobium lacus]BCB27086.1 1,4-alpha-glucan branching enzyme GlgB [Sulfurimicrobium lacus]
MKPNLSAKVNTNLKALLKARHHDPFSFLGLHQEGEEWSVRLFLPFEQQAEIQMDSGWVALDKIHSDGVFFWHGASKPPLPYRLRVARGAAYHEFFDPYAFPSLISDLDLHLFGEGRLYQGYRMLGAQPAENMGVKGVRFAVWAPNAERVSVVGDFNRWDGRAHPMRSLGSSGVWELFIPEFPAGNLYKFELRNRHSGQIVVKTDPFAQEYELRPGTAAKVTVPQQHVWGDQTWMEQRGKLDWLHAPFNIYEIHPGSWRRHPDNRVYNWRELAENLVPYVVDLAYTHIELMPVSEHPLDESWGYQATGYFAPTSRFGTPDDFRFFVDACHQAGIGVILDWVPAHFPQDAWALAKFDGTSLYEHEDPRLGFHQDWGTHIFNYGRHEVQSFLLSSAHIWLHEFHLDGLRVDAVASMLYLDYSRKAGEWIPNKFGGRENLDAIEFLRSLNIMVHDEFPGALTFAEESTSWPMVSRPVYLGGLGFSMKWNMGWMNDTLEYIRHEPIHRRFHHNELTFGQLYAYTENFVLPFSHDEVVHGKGSLLDKMPGDAWQKFANLRALLTYQMTYPGKKLNFMGNEIGQGREWRVGGELDWQLLQVHWHQGMLNLNRDLNRLYREMPSLYQQDFEATGFSWVDCHDADQSILSYLRWGHDGSMVAVVLNFTPVPREGYRIGVPKVGAYREIFNSDSAYYGGSNTGNGSGMMSESQPWMGFEQSLVITVPPLAGIILTPIK